jgi:hypothetical protein
MQAAGACVLHSTEDRGRLVEYFTYCAPGMCPDMVLSTPCIIQGICLQPLGYALVCFGNSNSSVFSLQDFFFFVNDEIRDVKVISILGS